MSQDDLLVRNAVQRMGVNASVEWTRQCISFKNKQDASSPPATSNQDLAQFIFEMYLLADFRILEPKPLLPSSIATPHNQNLFTDFGGNSVRPSRSGGGIILQILEIQDIGISSLKMLEACEAIGVKGDQPGGFPIEKTLPKGMIALDLTDGVRKMRALVMEPIAGIAMEMKIGAKIRVRDVQVKHGVLHLNPGNTFLLGGEVASMNQHPRRLVIMNQMKKKLGLPLDILPTAGNAPPSTPQAMSTSNSTSAAFSNITINTNNNNNSHNNHNSSSSSVNSALKNLWSNPQAAVRAQDSIPSTTSPNGSVWRAPIIANDTPNPWKSFKPHQSTSPEPDLQLRDEQEDYMRMLEEQQPQWDFHQDMEMDDIGLPGNDVDWDVSSNLSMDDAQRGLDRKMKEVSPGLLDTKSPVKRGLQVRRSLSLKSPHSRQQDRRRADSWEVETSLPIDYKALNARGSDGGDMDVDRKSPSRDIFNTSNLSQESDKFDIKTERGAGISRKSSPGIISPSDLGQDSGDLKHLVDAEMQSQRNADKTRGSKRRVSPEYDSGDRDYSTNRRRSRSFVPSPHIEGNDDAQIKDKLEKDNDLLLNIKKEAVKSVLDRYSRAEEIIPRELSDEFSRSPVVADDTPFSDSEMQSVNIKIEKTEIKKSDGASYHAAIELLSDDDGDGSKFPSSDQDISELDIQMKIKSEPNATTFIPKNLIVKSEPGTTYSQSYVSESSVSIKQEVTLLEFDMDDDYDFGGLTEVIHVVPEVELDKVEISVREGSEVKAQARVHKLGKFSLTTLAVSIPITLLPVVSPPHGENAVTEGITPATLTDTKVEAVLDQPVVELLLDYSITQFRELVRINEPEAKKAVGRLRSTLSEVETVECYFKGLRSNIPVIRELKILSKKHR
ncbi:hypothetical protein BGX26_007732 [Mortierella sp. AD094]|nr:hypothetical protein BGX26_007732 [Mortierella sp. AD094]